MLIAWGRSDDMARFADLTQLRVASLAVDDEPLSARGPLARVHHPIDAGTILFLLAVVRDRRPAETAILYILIGLRFEEATLIRRRGPASVACRAAVPALLPWRGRASPRGAP